MTDIHPDGFAPSERAPGRQARTYHRFTLLLKSVVICLATAIVFLTVSFGAGGGLAWGVIDALVVAGAGIYAMRHGLAHSSEAESLPPPQRDVR